MPLSEQEELELLSLEREKSGGGAGPQPQQPTLIEQKATNYKNIGMGALKGAADIGATILSPIDALMGKTDRRQQLGEFFKDNADPESLAFKGGELATDIAGTAGVGGLITKVGQVAKYAPRLASALETGGLSLGKAGETGGTVGNAVARLGGGATVGGASAGLVNPEDTGVGAAIGSAIPVAGAVGRAVIPKAAAPDVAKLAERASALGIDIPADRIINSRPLNAVAASLNYIPMSGRAGTEEKMVGQLNRALSRTFGQDSDNVTGALKKANLDLNYKFDRTLKTNNLVFDKPLVNDLVKNLQEATTTMTPQQAARIDRISADFVNKGKWVNGQFVVDGEAAYNIKKLFDRLGNSTDSEIAHHAREMKKSLMGALERSMGPNRASEFKNLRQQYGAMLDLENISQRGAEGGVSIGKLANLGHTNNPQLDELADIAAQFLKTRESPHGALQRVVLGTGAAAAGLGTGTLPLVAAGIGGARATNAALNSKLARDAALGKLSVKKLSEIAENPAARAAIYGTAGE